MSRKKSVSKGTSKPKGGRLKKEDSEEAGEKPATELEVISGPLGRDEKSRLKRLETDIEQGISRFMRVGKALAEIRDARLYREEHATFEDYLRERWGITRQYAYAQIKGAEVVNNLSTIADKLPENESQVRPLTRLTPEKQIAVWEEALRQKEPVTGELVSRLAKAHIPPKEVFQAPGVKGKTEWGDKALKDFIWFYERLIANVPARHRLEVQEKTFEWIDQRRWELAKTQR